MEKENARKQTLEQLHERRKQVVRLHKKGIKIMQIVEMTGLSYPPVRATIDLFEAGGWGAIRPALRGRSPGDGRVLSPAQEETIQRMIIDKRPEQLKMDFHLWSRAAVSGACQGSCRLIYAAKGCLRSAFMWSATTESRSGLRVTAPIGDQSRVVPDQRAGLRSRALRYSSCRAARMA